MPRRPSIAIGSAVAEVIGAHVPIRSVVHASDDGVAAIVGSDRRASGEEHVGGAVVDANPWPQHLAARVEWARRRATVAEHRGDRELGAERGEAETLSTAAEPQSGSED